jgi:hypothetical protein
MLFMAVLWKYSRFSLKEAIAAMVLIISLTSYVSSLVVHIVLRLPADYFTYINMIIQSFNNNFLSILNIFPFEA